MWHILFFISAVIAAILITLPKRNPVRKIIIRTPVILGTLLKTRSFKDTAMTIAGSSGSGCQDRCCGSNKVIDFSTASINLTLPFQGHPGNMPDPETLAKMQKQYQMQLQMAGRMNQNHLQKSAATPSTSVFIPVEEDDLD